MSYRCGPSGGHGGTEFGDDALPNNSKVDRVVIRAGRRVDSVQIIHIRQGVKHPFPRHGGTGGTEQSIDLDNDEYIIGIEGRFGPQENKTPRVHSIRIRTNKQDFPRQGGNGGSVDYFYRAPEGAEIAGFYGRAGGELDAVGVILRELPPSLVNAPRRRL